MVGAAFADKGSGGGGSGSGGGGSDHSGSGGGDSDGDGGGSDDGGGDNSGSGKRGDDKKGAEAEKADRAEKRDVQRFLDRLQHGGSVAFASITESGVEVRYSDGWSEAVSGGRYRLMDGRQRVVADRPARKSDLKRLSAAAATR